MHYHLRQKTDKDHFQARIIFNITAAFNILLLILWVSSLTGFLGNLFEEFAIFIPLIGAIILLMLFSAFENRAKNCFETRRKKKFLKAQLILLILLAFVSAGI